MMIESKVDFAAKFYVRLEDERERLFQLDYSVLDGGWMDEAPTLLERVQARNRRDLVNPDARL